MRMVARAEVRADNQLVLEAVGPLDEVVEVHVAELVDLLAAVVGPDEAHFGDEDLGLVDRRVVVEAGRAGIAGVGDERHAHLPRYGHPGQPQTANAVAWPGRKP